MSYWTRNYSSTTQGVAADLPLEHMWKCLIQRSRLLRRKRTCCGFLCTFMNRIVSGWTGLNIMVRIEVKVSKVNICYLPTIDALATNMSSVFEVLNQSLKIKNRLKQNYIKLSFLIRQFMLKRLRLSGSVTNELRKGVFHIICLLLGIIGKRFHGAGFRTLCIESQVIAKSSVSELWIQPCRSHAQACL